MTFAELVKDYLVVFLMSMVPVVELRGAIPYGIGFGLPIIPTYLVAIIGNVIPVPFLVVFSKRVLEWLAGFRGIGPFFQRIIDKATAKSGSRRFRNSAFLALFLFVAVPVPGTGAWTGSLIAAILRMDWKRALAAIALGVLTAGIIMMLLSAGIFGGLGVDISLR